jgi:hypothetical protein
LAKSPRAHHANIFCGQNRCRYCKLLSNSVGFNSRNGILHFLRKELDYLNQQKFNELEKLTGETKAMLIGLIKKIRTRINPQA